MKIMNVFSDEKFRRIEKQPNYYGAVLPLAELFGAEKLGFHLEVIDPGNFSAPYHFHEQEEELFLVIEGEAIVRHNNAFSKVKAGDMFFYPVGPESAHNMYNHTEKQFRFLGLCNISAEYDVCHYPDSGKVSSEEGFKQAGNTVSYFKDEEDPAKYWPEHALRGDV